MKVLIINLTAFCTFFYNFQMSTVTANGNKIIAENFNAVSQIIKRTEQCKFCMKIAGLKLNFHHQATDSVGLHVITWKKRRFRLKQNF